MSTPNVTRDAAPAAGYDATVKQKTAYEIVCGDWSSDVCSSDLVVAGGGCGVSGHVAVAHVRFPGMPVSDRKSVV